MTLGPISRLPIGLLDVFDVRTLGKYPRNIADQLVATYDVTPLQHLNVEHCRAQWDNAAAAIVAPAGAGMQSFTSFVVEGAAAAAETDVNEFWLITRLSAVQSITLGGGGVATWPMAQVVYLPNLATSTQFHVVPPFNRAGTGTGSSILTGIANGTVSAWTVGTVQPFVVPPQSAFRAWFEAAGPAITVNDTMTFTCWFDFIRLHA